MKNKKEALRIRRQLHGRVRINGTLEKPRLAVHRSIKNMQAQVVDDVSNKTLFSLSTTDKEIKAKFPNAGNLKAAEFFGEMFAKKAIEKRFIEEITTKQKYYLFISNY